MKTKYIIIIIIKPKTIISKDISDMYRLSYNMDYIKRTHKLSQYVIYLSIVIVIVGIQLER